MKDKFITFYLKTALELSNLSHAQRLKVGCLAVKDNRIISLGYNGTPANWDNECEFLENEKLITKPEVIHAEYNCLLKLARSNESGLDATIFCTHSPCIECAKGIYGAGISRFYYIYDYRSDVGLEFLKKCGIEVDRVGI